MDKENRLHADSGKEVLSFMTVLFNYFKDQEEHPAEGGWATGSGRSAATGLHM